MSILKDYEPNVYTLSSRPELRIDTTDANGYAMIPIEARISVKQPDGQIITYSGGDMEFGPASGYMYVLYKPPTKGWFEIEVWARDATGREDANSRGFEVTDRVY